jgi:hypothetical protein
MKIQCTRSKNIICLPSDSNRDLGLFLIFTGIVAVPPVYWLYFYYTSRSVQDWGPSIFIGALWAVAGFFFIFFSRKRISVGKDYIRIADGFLKKPFNIRWKGSPKVRLRYDEEERKGRVKEYWETSLIDGKLEYTIDRREQRQLESRALGETIARYLGCELIERDEEGRETVIAPGDLDLPFRQRVIKYPGLLRKPVEAPRHEVLKIEERNRALLVSWGIKSTGVLLDLAVLVSFLFLFAIFPLKQGTHSFYQQCALRGDFYVFYIAGFLILFTVLVVLGYRARLKLSRNGAIFWVTIWGLPLRVRRIKMSEIEEIHITPSNRGPRIQIVSDRQIISFRLLDRPAARWLSYRLQQYMLQDPDHEEVLDKLMDIMPDS